MKTIKYASLIDQRAKAFNTITLTILLGWAVVLMGGFFAMPTWKEVSRRPSPQHTIRFRDLDHQLGKGKKTG